MRKLQKALREFVDSEMIQDPGHDLAHLDRVWATAHYISKTEENVDLEVLMAAAYLHDLVNVPKTSKRKSLASKMSAESAKPFLEDYGFSPTRIRATQHAIHAHSFSAGIEPRSIEAKIIRDADRIDALGATGIARIFAIGGALGRSLYDVEDPFGEDRDLDGKVHTLDIWPSRLLSLPSDMMTDKGREIARKRLDIMVNYIEQLGIETNNSVPDIWKECLDDPENDLEEDQGMPMRM